MKILLIGATGTIGQLIDKELSKDDDKQIIRVGNKDGDYQVDSTSEDSVRALFEKVGKVDAIISAAGSYHFGPLDELDKAKFTVSTDNFLAQASLVYIGKDYLNANGSITLTSGILSDDPIVFGSSASAMCAAVNAFVKAAAIELENGIRVNAVSPTALVESWDKFGPFFSGFEPVSGQRVALAYRKSVDGKQTGQEYRVW